MVFFTTTKVESNYNNWTFGFVAADGKVPLPLSFVIINYYISVRWPEGESITACRLPPVHSTVGLSFFISIGLALPTGLRPAVTSLTFYSCAILGLYSYILSCSIQGLWLKGGDRPADLVIKETQVTQLADELYFQCQWIEIIRTFFFRCGQRREYLEWGRHFELMDASTSPAAAECDVRK